MFGDQEPTGDTIDVYLHKNGKLIHKQIQQKNNRTYMRLTTRSVTNTLLKQ